MDKQTLTAQSDSEAEQAAQADALNMRHPRWYVGRVTRPDAGGQLYAPIHIVDNQQVEHGVTPTYDEGVVREMVKRLNGGQPI